MSFDTIMCGTVDPVEQDLKRQQAKEKRESEGLNECVNNFIENMDGSDIRSFGFEGLTESQANDLAIHYSIMWDNPEEAEHRLKLIANIVTNAIHGWIVEDCEI